MATPCISEVPSGGYTTSDCYDLFPNSHRGNIRCIITRRVEDGELRKIKVKAYTDVGNFITMNLYYPTNNKPMKEILTPSPSPHGRRPRTFLQVEKAKQLHEQGFSWRVIAKELNTNVGTVYCACTQRKD